MTPTDPQPLIDDRSRPWFPACYWNIDHGAANQIFRVEPVVLWVDGLGDADYYAAKFDCGLLLGFEFLHHSHGVVFAPTPNPQHALRHLSRWSDTLTEVPAELQEPDRRYIIEEFAPAYPDLSGLTCCQVYRMGDDGNAMPVGDPTCRSDAECWVAELESHLHKQIYWIEDARSPAKRG